MQTSQPLVATLEPVRFGEFLRDRALISDEQWLAALAHHWSASRRRKLGAAIIEMGFLSVDMLESEARVFHDDLEVVEVVEVVPRSERATIPSMPMPMD